MTLLAVLMAWYTRGLVAVNHAWDQGDIETAKWMASRFGATFRTDGNGKELININGQEFNLSEEGDEVLFKQLEKYGAEIAGEMKYDAMMAEVRAGSVDASVQSKMVNVLKSYFPAGVSTAMAADAISGLTEAQQDLHFGVDILNKLRDAERNSTSVDDSDPRFAEIQESLRNNGAQVVHAENTPFSTMKIKFDSESAIAEELGINTEMQIPVDELLDMYKNQDTLGKMAQKMILADKREKQAIAAQEERAKQNPIAFKDQVKYYIRKHGPKAMNLFRVHNPEYFDSDAPLQLKNTFDAAFLNFIENFRTDEKLLDEKNLLNKMEEEDKESGTLTNDDDPMTYLEGGPGTTFSPALARPERPATAPARPAPARPAPGIDRTYSPALFKSRMLRARIPYRNNPQGTD